MKSALAALVLAVSVDGGLWLKEGHVACFNADGGCVHHIESWSWIIVAKGDKRAAAIAHDGGCYIRNGSQYEREFSSFCEIAGPVLEEMERKRQIRFQ